MSDQDKPSDPTGRGAAEAARAEVASAMSAAQSAIAKALSAARSANESGTKAALETIQSSNERVASVVSAMKGNQPLDPQETRSAMDAASKAVADTLAALRTIEEGGVRAAQQSIKQAVEATSRAVADAVKITSMPSQKR